MAKDTTRLWKFRLRDMLSVAYGHAVPIDTNGIHRCLIAGFTPMAQRISVPISWGSPPILI
jgi:hypothetical protein